MSLSYIRTLENLGGRLRSEGGAPKRVYFDLEKWWPVEGAEKIRKRLKETAFYYDVQQCRFMAPQAPSSDRRYIRAAISALEKKAGKPPGRDPIKTVARQGRRKKGSR